MTFPSVCLRWRRHSGSGRSLRHLQRRPSGFLGGGAGPDGGGRSQPAGGDGETSGGWREHRRLDAGAEVNYGCDPLTFLTLLTLPTPTTVTRDAPI